MILAPHSSAVYAWYRQCTVRLHLRASAHYNEWPTGELMVASCVVSAIRKVVEKETDMHKVQQRQKQVRTAFCTCRKKASHGLYRVARLEYACPLVRSFLAAWSNRQSD